MAQRGKPHMILLSAMGANNSSLDVFSMIFETFLKAFSNPSFNGWFLVVPWRYLFKEKWVCW